MGISPVLLTVTMNYFMTSYSFNSLQNDDQTQLEQIVMTQIQQEQNNLQAAVQSLATTPEIVAMLQATNRADIEQKAEALFKKLQQEQQLAVFELGDANGKVHIRGHQISQAGDDKSDSKAIQATLAGDVLSGLEYGKSGLVIRSFAPVKANGEIIGTLQIGVNDSFMQLLQDMLPFTQLQFLAADSTAAQDPAAFEQAKAGEPARVLLEEQRLLESYLPFVDPTGEDILGVLQLTQNINLTQSIKDNMILAGGIILLLVAIGGVIVSTLFARSLSKPIVKTANTLQTLRSGDLTQKLVPEKRRDEIGMMMNDMRSMQEQLHGTIQEVSAASNLVATQSAQLNDDVASTSAGAQTITQVMSEISSSTERQSFAISDVSETVNDFANRLCETSQQGQQLQTSSEYVLNLSEKGAELMRHSTQHMQNLQQMMQDTVTKMSALDHQAHKITAFVSIIEDVANQTNLLALNASIEAARAGEHGKGFSVVAEEVRKLAEEVEQSVAEITTIVSGITGDSSKMGASLLQGYEQMEANVSQLTTTSQTFDEIEHAVAQISQTIAAILKDIDGMTNESQEISATVQEIAAISEETTAAVEETTGTLAESGASMLNISHATKELMQLSERLDSIVKQYKI